MSVDRDDPYWEHEMAYEKRLFLRGGVCSDCYRSGGHNPGCPGYDPPEEDEEDQDDEYDADAKAMEADDLRDGEIDIELMEKANEKG